MVLVKHAGETPNRSSGTARSAVESWCQINAHQLPNAGETKEFEWESLLKEVHSDGSSIMDGS